MPVTTRNQSKMMNASASSIQKVESGFLKYPSAILDLEKQEKQIAELTQSDSLKNVRPDTQDAIYPWFINTLKKSLVAIDEIKLEKKSSHLCGEKDKLRVLHYEQLRHVTEMMFMVGQYYPTVRNLSPKMLIFGQVAYAKVKQLYKEIRVYTDYKPKTQEENEIIAALISTLHDVEKTLIPYTKRHRNVVDYTGMDTIEPECEYDGITDIWYDESVWYDSDYVPEDDEDEDEDEEDDEDDEDCILCK
jgi:hypothetical protein